MDQTAAMAGLRFAMEFERRWNAFSWQFG